MNRLFVVASVLVLLAGPARGEDALSSLPDQEAMKRASVTIREIFGNELSEAKTADAKRELAKKMIALAKETIGDPATEFVLLSEVCDLGAEAADFQVLLESIDIIKQRYSSDVSPMLATALEKIEKKPLPSVTELKIARAAFDAAFVASNAEQFDAAERLFRVARSASMRGHDTKTAARSKTYLDGLGAKRRESHAAHKAKEALAANESDPIANLTLGKYLCFACDNWKDGLPCLVKGGDAELKRLAEISMAVGADVPTIASAGDEWWNAAQTRKGREAESFKAGARHFYAIALPGLLGIPKAKIEGRMADYSAAAKASQVHRANPAVDLLKLIDVDRNIVAGKWERTPDQGAIAGTGKVGLLQVPLVPTGEYVLTVDITRRGPGITPFVIILPIPGRQFYLLIDAPPTGIGMIDGEFPNTNETLTTAVRLPKDKIIQVICTITAGGVAVTIGGRKVIEFSGRFDRLSIRGSGYEIPNTAAIGFGTNGTGIMEISRAELSAPK